MARSESAAKQMLKMTEANRKSPEHSMFKKFRVASPQQYKKVYQKQLSERLPAPRCEVRNKKGERCLRQPHPEGTRHVSDWRKLRRVLEREGQEQ